MAIDIPVSASFNDGEIKSQISQINAQIKELGSAVAAANKQKFEPISLRSKEDLKTFVQQTQQLLKLQTELKHRMHETGQAGKMPLAANWAKLYPNVQQRNQKLQEVLGFYGNDFSDMDASGVPGRRRRHGAGGAGGGGGGGSGGGGGGGGAGGGGAGGGGAGGGGRFWGGITQAGLNAAGPVGQTAGSAVGAGMRGGLGMGLMGLAGGLLALGVGKAIGGVTAKMGEAEENAVAYDTLKRTLGDVNIAFNQLKTVVKGTGDQYSITYAESARLAAMYGKAGNLSGREFKGMGGEVGAGIGLSRSFGLDPAQGVGTLGAMRGLGITRNEGETRRFALLIGETIGKAGAFAKADEVMDALASYASSQTRLSLSQNIAGYSGHLSSMIGQNITGLDVAGSAGLLARVNAALQSGGAKGEASQFFSYGIGSKLGLDPFQFQLFREGGSAATLSSVFGEGTLANQFGFDQREGDETFLSMTLRGLREQYAHLGPGALASATSSHLGISASQAMAVQRIQEPGHLNQLEKALEFAGVDIGAMKGSAISSMSQVLTGDADQRMSIAREMFGREGNDALSKQDRDWLNTSMETGDAVNQTETLLRLLANYGQEGTQGKDIRDSKNALENLNVSMAERLIPLTQAMRDGILYMAGGKDKKGPREIQEEMARLEVSEQFSDEIRSLEERRSELTPGWLVGAMGPAAAFDPGTMAEYQENLKLGREIRGVEERRDAAIDAKIQKIRSGYAAPGDEDESEISGPESWVPTHSGATPITPYSVGMDAGYGLGSSPGTSAADDALFSALIHQESGGRHYGKDGGLLQSSAGALGITQIMPATGRDPGFGVTPLQNDSKEEYMRLGRDYLNALLRYYGGDKRKALAAYNAGAGSVDKSVRNHGEGWLSNMSEETRNYVPSILSMADAYSTNMPHNSNSQGATGGNITVDPLQLEVSFTGPGTVNAPPQLNTHLGPARPM